MTELSNQKLRIGLPWNTEEEMDLLREIKRNESIQEIAKKHGRTEGGIHSRLRSLAADYYYYNKKSIDDICLIVRLDKKTVQDAIDRRKPKNNYNEEKKTEKTSENKIIEILLKINNNLEEIKEILKEKNLLY